MRTRAYETRQLQHKLNLKQGVQAAADDEERKADHVETLLLAAEQQLRERQRALDRAANEIARLTAENEDFRAALAVYQSGPTLPRKKRLLFSFGLFSRPTEHHVN